MATIPAQESNTPQSVAAPLSYAPASSLYSCWGVHFAGNEHSKAGWVQDHSGMPSLFSKANAENLCPNPQYTAQPLYVCAGVAVEPIETSKLLQQLEDAQQEVLNHNAENKLLRWEAKLANKVLAAAKRSVTWLDHANCVLPDDGELGSMRSDMNALRELLPPTPFCASEAEPAGAGTPSARLGWMLAELAKVFPEAANEYGGAPPELAYFERIVQMAAESRAQGELPGDADADDQLDHGQTVLDVQGALGITTTGWVSPDVIKMRLTQLVEFKKTHEGDRRTVVGERINAAMYGTLCALKTYLYTSMTLLPTVSWRDGANLSLKDLQTMLDRNFGVQLTAEEAERLGYRCPVVCEELESLNLVSATIELQAARYRWLRNKSTGSQAAKVLSIFSSHMTDGLDKAVDAAIAAEKAELEATKSAQDLSDIYACDFILQQSNAEIAAFTEVTPDSQSQPGVQPLKKLLQELRTTLQDGANLVQSIKNDGVVARSSVRISLTLAAAALAQSVAQEQVRKSAEDVANLLRRHEAEKASLAQGHAEAMQRLMTDSDAPAKEVQ